MSDHEDEFDGLENGEEGDINDEEEINEDEAEEDMNEDDMDDMDGDDDPDGELGAEDEDEEIEDDTLTCPTRPLKSLRAMLEEDHEHDLYNHLHKAKLSAWFYQPDKVNTYTKDLFGQANSAQLLKSQKWGFPELTTVHHVRPLQWYGCRFHSLATGRLAISDRRYERMRELEFGDRYDEISADMPQDVWTVATFAILDANSRAFPFMMEWNRSFVQHNRAFIYTCKREVGTSKPTPDICIGRVSRAVGAPDEGDSVITIDMNLLHSALPTFAATYVPHGLTDTARAHASLAGKVFFHTAVALSKKDATHPFPVPETFSLDDLYAAINQYDMCSTSNNASDLFSHVKIPGEHFDAWLLKLRQFYTTLSREEILRNQLEVMCGAAVAMLFEKVPNHLFTENQPIVLRQQLTVEALTRLTPEQAKAFTSAALPPSASSMNATESNASSSAPPFKKQKLPAGDGSSSSTSTPPSESRWPHADIVWGSAETRPLPNELIRLIAEYTLDDLELVDLPWIEAEEQEFTHPEDDHWRGGHLLFGRK